MNGMKGTCFRCGAAYYDWGLSNPEKQQCSRCGGALEIRRDGVLIQSAVPPYEAAGRRSASYWDTRENMLEGESIFRWGRN
jgi:NAD-dependent SIR2 family protein deacetylase